MSITEASIGEAVVYPPSETHRIADAKLAEPVDPFEPYRREAPDGTVTRAAGMPGYPNNFSRDVFLAGIIASSADMIDEQSKASAARQGTVYDPGTGEEPGKIHHEWPGVPVNGRSLITTYNACDTTALFCLSAKARKHLGSQAVGDTLHRWGENIERCADYITRHIGPDGLFWERPPEGVEAFGLYVTYWKDSMLPCGRKEPAYPVMYTQAQFVNAAGLRAAGELLERSGLVSQADAMFEAGIRKSIQRDGFVVYEDAATQLSQISSDELHSLAFIPVEYKPLLPLDDITKRAETLKTPFGYMCMPEADSARLADPYHGAKVWSHEQAYIHYGAVKFGLGAVATVAALVEPHIGTGQELFGIRYENGVMASDPDGNRYQLWAVAAQKYLEQQRVGRSALANTQCL
jgi:hypothetical protein